MHPVVTAIYAALVVIAMALPKPYYPPGKNPETREQYEARVEIVIEAVSLEAPLARGPEGEEWLWPTEDLISGAFIKMWSESRRLSLEVHNGTRKGDNGKSVCLGQIMYGSKKLVGTDLAATRRCTAKVMQIMIQHQHRCLRGKARSNPSPTSMARIYSGYGTGYSCSPNVHYVRHGKRYYWARDRAWMWWRVRNKLNKSR